MNLGLDELMIVNAVIGEFTRNLAQMTPSKPSRTSFKT